MERESTFLSYVSSGLIDDASDEVVFFEDRGATLRVLQEERGLAYP